MLDSHPQVAIPPETGFVPAALTLKGEGDSLRRAFFDLLTGFPPGLCGWQDFKLDASAFAQALAAIHPFTVAEGLRCFYRLYAARFQKGRWGEKTPGYVHSMLQIEAVLPEARFVHVIRDGRGVALSLRQMWFAPGRDMRSLASYWALQVREGRSQGAKAGHYLEVRFEDLVLHTERELRRICAFGGLPFAADMLEYHRRVPQRLEEHEGRTRADGTVFMSKEARWKQQQHTRFQPDASKIGSWRHGMTAAERAEFEAAAGDILSELGYL